MKLSLLKHISVLLSVSLVVFVLFIAGCSEDPTIIDYGELHEENLSDFAEMGGGLTIDNAGGEAFSERAPNLTGLDYTLHLAGRTVFRESFVAPPATLSFGLGPLYAHSSCNSCHISGGRGKPINGSEAPESMMLRISIPGATSTNGPLPVPNFGVVLHPRATGSIRNEGNITVTYITMSGAFDDGGSYTLRKPKYSITNAYSSLPSSMYTSARIAQPLVGLGLLEAIKESDIQANVDENDADGDGISGRANYVHNYLTFSSSIGRFGWKADIATVNEQSAFDFQQGMGVTIGTHPYNFENCKDQIQGVGELLDDPEANSGQTLYPLTVYLKTTGVPKRRNMNTDIVRRGQKLFTDAECIKCHVESYTTGTSDDIDQLNDQKVYPYTDMLLHDMGDELADNRTEYLATGREWRTPPLWGIGLTETVNGSLYFLHDGRARNLVEAILWHGGEADSSKNLFVKMSKQDRDALIAFLNSL
ncbi:MAG TPA: di-heme oxidoredictase family protein [Candidatus Kapabacteria bacterium]